MKLQNGTPPRAVPKTTGGAEPGKPTTRTYQRAGTKRKATKTEGEKHLPSATQRKTKAGYLQPDHKVITIKGDTDRQTVLAYCRHLEPGTPVVMVSSPSGLDENNLTSTLTAPAEGNEGEVVEAKGLLFSGERVTLVSDLTNMSQGQIASINDVLDKRPTLKGEPLNPKVRRVVLIESEMYTPGPGKPHSDCWRRLQAFPSWQSADEIRANSREMGNVLDNVQSNWDFLNNRIFFYPEPDSQPLSETLSSGASASSSAKVTHQPVNFAMGNYWRELLFGALTVGERGKFCFRTGRLETLSDGDSVILKDAPWDDPDFVRTLARAMREGGFVANGRKVTLPGNLKWFRTETSPEALVALKQRLVKGDPHSDVSFACLNGDSFETTMVNYRIHNGTGCAVDSLSQLLAGCQQLRITGTLTDRQWLQLLLRVDQMDPKPEIAVDFDAFNSGNLPEIPISTRKGFRNTISDYFGSVRKEPSCINANRADSAPSSVNNPCRLYAHEATALAEWTENHKVYRFTAKDQWETLWQITSMTSQNNFHFVQEDTELLTALKNGQPVVFHGMDKRPSLSGRLESLLANPAYLFVNGQKIVLPKANVTFLWPVESQSQIPKQKLSTLWQQALQQAESPPALAGKQQELIAILNSLPRSALKHYPATPPWQALNFNHLLEQQVELEKQQDGASGELPVHRRKALHTLLVKPYRGDARVYGYLKTRVSRLYPDRRPEYLADRHALQDWLQQHPTVDRKMLETHFWSLVRHCPIERFDHLPDTFETPAKEDLDRLADFLIGCTSEDQQETLASQLQVDLIDSDYCQYYDSEVRARLYDALLAAGDQRQSSKAISELVKTVGTQIASIIAQTDASTLAEERVRGILKTIISDDLLKGDFKDLPAALLNGHKGSRLRQIRRVKRLAERVKQYPLVFLQGEAGAGKSHMARVVAGELKKNEKWAEMPDPVVLSLGPGTTPEFLYGQQTMEESMDGDARSRFIPGPVLAWAMDPNPPVLILDEANLAQEGVLAPLAGLSAEPPSLSYQGNIYELTDRHRVILTGNPDHYDGRTMDSTLRQRMLTLYYRPLSPTTLGELILRPGLPGSWSHELKNHTTRAMLSLYQYYASLLPEALTPRDLQDVLARMQQTLRHRSEHGPGQHPDVVITTEQANALVWEAFSDSLAGTISAARHPGAEALQHWFQGHFPGDDSLMEQRNKAFEGFLKELRDNNQDVDLHSAPVVDLIRNYWKFLDKQENSRQGRRGMLVEGPAGWGKDLTLRRVLTLWEQQHPGGAAFVHINANPAQWDDMVKTVETGAIKGQKTVISEINLLPSRCLDGLLNETITSHAVHPDFALFATMNPASFGGRQTLSAALNNRCTRIQLSPLNSDDLKGMLLRRPSVPEAVVAWLPSRYQALSDQLKIRQSPIQLTLDDLFQGADALKDVKEDQWLTRLAQVYWLPLQSIKLSAESLEALASQPMAMDDGRPERQRSLSLALNRTSEHPMRVEQLPPDAQPQWDSAQRRLSLPDGADEKELLPLGRFVLKGGDDISGGTVVAGAFGGNITSPAHYKIGKIFQGDAFATGDYRLTLKQLLMRDGTLQEVDIPCDAGGFTKLTNPGWPEQQINLLEEQQLGCHTVRLSQKNWTPLPGLSSMDQLIYLRARNKSPAVESLEVARGNATGQLLVKLADKVPNRSVTLDFIIKPDQAGLTELRADTRIQVQSGLCDEAIRQRLDADVFSRKARLSPICLKLQRMMDERNVTQQLLILAGIVKEFEGDRDAPGQGLDLLIYLICHGLGVCRHISQVFQVICQYLGVPARMCTNVNHKYIEISPDGGQHWLKIELGGGRGGGGEVTKDIVKPDFAENVSLTASPQKHAGGSMYEYDWQMAERLVDQYNNETTRAQALKEIETHLSPLSKDRRMPFLPLKLSFIIPNLLQTNDLEVPRMILASLRKQVKQPSFFHKRPDLLVKHILTDIQRHCGQDIWLKAENSALMDDCLYWLEQDDYTKVYDFLPFLEQLSQHPHHGQRANRLLDSFYQTLTCPREWGAYIENLPPEPYCEPGINLGGQSKTLLRELKQVTVEQHWSQFFTGKPPNVERQIQKQPAFPVSTEGQQARPVFFSCLAETEDFNIEKILSEYIADIKAQKKIPGLKKLECPPDKYASAFFSAQKMSKAAFYNWLLRQKGIAETRPTLISRYAKKHNNVIIEYPGCYPLLPSLNSGIIRACSNICEVGDYREYIILHPDRIKKAFNSPTALVITPKLLAIGYREYLETMDWRSFWTLDEI